MLGTTMNWDAVGAIAELVGSIAVVATLIFLAFQVRQNSASVRNATSQHSSSATAHVLTQLTLNPELHDIYRRGVKAADALSGEELGRFDFLLLQMFRDCDVQFQHYASGGTNKEQWEAIARTIHSVAKTPGGNASWKRQKIYTTDSFQTELERMLHDK